ALTTFKIGGPADLLVEPVNTEELQRVLRFCQTEHLPWMVLGLGSNLLVRDKGIRGVVIKLGGSFARWSVNGTQVTAGAAVSLSELSKAMVSLGLSGLEFACGIPGSVGGAVYMNAGAYDGEIAEVLTSVEAVGPETPTVWYEKNELEFGYRKSRFQNGTEVVTKLVFDLKPELRTAIGAKVDDLTRKRECKQPLELPSAGSVFRRPEGYYVGPLIEQAGLKGFQIGGAQVSPKHAGFIVNVGGAAARDVLDLIQHIRTVIRERNGVDLVPEIKVIGEE
ncbi:MAG TPA: UDP-N-acetylmuramate dehydrogenase, partial [Bacillota bacterium]|nr:UDP-N-acetylmuramate dehydrogenase [Bacillota bacterium]